MNEQIENLSLMQYNVSELSSLHDKIEFLQQNPNVRGFLEHSSVLQSYLQNTHPKAQFALLSLLALNQGPIVFQGLESLKKPEEALSSLVQVLLSLETHYQLLGGVIGYHLKVLKLIKEKRFSSPPPSQAFSSNASLIKPEGLDISRDNPTVKKYTRAGIEALPLMAEIYPVGGSGDRLGLVDSETGKPLPAAKLNFGGISLLEGLFCDLEAKETLYFQLTGKQIITPVALMTSLEKNNHALILELCEENQWFGRPKDSIRTFTQPLVPVITIEGHWCISAPLQLNLKPGGHGVLWKTALEAGIFDWFLSCQRSKLLIRQINNPIAGMDYGLLAFIGYGCREGKTFGFASCPRALNAHEGMNVIIQTKKEGHYDYCLTNLEYTDFAQKGIQDIPEKPGSPFSALPSNTNLLFADIKAIQEITPQSPFPGLLINMKTKTSCYTSANKTVELPAGRLESTMQNIADSIVDSYPQPLRPGEFSRLRSYLTYHLRRKTISVTKSLYEPGKDLLGTPEGCLFDILENYEELFKDHCGFDMPSLGSKEDYLKYGPPFYIRLHPSIGPLFSIIAQKIHKGKIVKGSELQLEIADLEIKELHLEGSLRIIEKKLSGEKKPSKLIHQGIETSQCTLRKVNIKNKGINRSSPQEYWSNHLIRSEEMVIYLEENSEFIAENITFSGPYKIVVPAGQRLIATQDQGPVQFKTEPALQSAKWRYSFDSSNSIRLS